MTEAIVRQIHKSLLKNGITLSIAESCTGGLLSELLTRTSGSSQYFILGLVTYHNKVKERVLGIPKDILATEGAVSAVVAKKMAQAVRKIAKADFGIGITGIAGPTGATTSKPIGTVFIAVASKNKAICQEFHFKGKRERIRKKSALKALMLLKKLLKHLHTA